MHQVSTMAAVCRRSGGGARRFFWGVVLLLWALCAPVSAWAGAFSVSNGVWPATTPALPDSGVRDGIASFTMTLGGDQFVVATGNGSARLTRDSGNVDCAVISGAICIDSQGAADVDLVTFKRGDAAAFTVNTIAITGGYFGGVSVRFYKSGSEISGSRIDVAGSDLFSGPAPGAPLAVDEIRLVGHASSDLQGIDIVGLSGDSTAGAAMPAVNSVLPSSGPTAGGNTVTINGTGFTGATNVKFGNTAATGVTVVSDTRITATAPAGSAGTVDVRVTTSGGTSATGAPDQYTYVAAPAVTGVGSAMPNGSYKAGDVLDITATFDQTVTVTGTPTLLLETGAVDRAAVYLSGSGSSVLTFRYTVQIGDQSADLDYAGTSALALNGGTIRNGDNTFDANLTLPSPGAAGSLGANKALVIDGVAPVATGSVPDSGASASATSVDYTVTFSEPVTGVDLGDFVLTASGTAQGSVASVMTADNRIYTVTVNGIGGSGTLRVDMKASGTGIQDAAGNALSGGYTGGGTHAVSMVTVPGTPTIGTAMAGDAQASVAFAAPASDGGATITGYTATSNPGGFIGTCASSPCTVTGLINGTAYTFTVTATNSAGTGPASAASNSVTPGPGPAVVSVGVPAAGTYAAGQNLDFIVNWDSPVTVNTAGGTPRIAITIGSQTVWATYLSGGGTMATLFRYTVLPGQTDADGISIGALTLDGGRISNAGGTDATLTLNSVASTAGVKVGAPTIALSPVSLANPAAGTAYSQTLTATGGTAPYTYAVAAGSLPAGLTLNTATGELSGTPTTAGTFNFTVQATDAGNFTGSRAYTVTIAAPTLSLAPAATALPAATAGVAYSQTLVATGGTAPYSYVVTAGALPAGLTLNEATGVLSGTPTAAGTFNVSITAMDSSTGTGAPFTVSKAYALTVVAPALTVAPVSTSVAYASTSNPVTLAITGNASSVSVSTAPMHGTATASGTSISYTPAPGYAGTDSFDYTATDAYTTSAPATVSITVATPSVALAPATLAAGTAGSAYAQAMSATGGSAPYSYAVTAGALPAGLTLNAATGVLSGTPTAAGTFNVSITATDSSTGTGPFTASKAYTLTVAAPSLVIEQASLPDAAGDQAYSQQLTVQGGAAPYRFDVSAGSLPTGLSLSASGQLSGKPTVAGHYDFTARVTDANGFTGTRAYSIGVTSSAQTITAFVATPAAPVYAEGGTFTVSAHGGASGNPVVFTSLSPSTCVVQGGDTITMRAAGMCSLAADQAGNAMYAAAVQVRLDVGIAAAIPSMTWLDGLSKTYGEADFDLPDPRSNSTGAFTFTSSDPAVARVSGRTVTLVGQGSVTLIATQAAAGNYAGTTASMRLVVGARPDPVADRQVTGGVQAQVDAGLRFAQVQMDNVHGRLRQLRSGQNPSSNNLSLAYAGVRSGSGLSLPVGQLGNAAMPSMPSGWGMWVSGTATFGKAGRNGRDGGGFDFNTGGISAGVDRMFSEHLLLGIAGGWGSQSTDFDDTPSKVDADQRSLSLYGLWRQGEHLFVDGLLGLGRLDFDTTRWSESAAASALGSRQGKQWYGSVTFGYEHRGRDGLSLTGYGRFDGQRATLDGYRERGLDALDLAYGRQTVDNSALAVGLEGDRTFKSVSRTWRPFWSMEYRKSLENQGDVSINYVQRPLDNDYAYTLRSYNDDMLTLGAGVDLQLESGWMFSLKLGHEQGRNALTSNSIGLLLRYGSKQTTPSLSGNGALLGSDAARNGCRRRGQECTTADGLMQP